MHYCIYPRGVNIINIYFNSSLTTIKYFFKQFINLLKKTVRKTDDGSYGAEYVQSFARSVIFRKLRYTAAKSLNVLKTSRLYRKTSDSENIDELRT